jgi:hypothetical protein
MCSELRVVIHPRVSVVASHDVRFPEDERRTVAEGDASEILTCAGDDIVIREALLWN